MPRSPLAKTTCIQAHGQSASAGHPSSSRENSRRKARGAGSRPPPHRPQNEPAQNTRHTQRSPHPRQPKISPPAGHAARSAGHPIHAAHKKQACAEHAARRQVIPSHKTSPRAKSARTYALRRKGCSPRPLTSARQAPAGGTVAHVLGNTDTRRRSASAAPGIRAPWRGRNPRPSSKTAPGG